MFYSRKRIAGHALQDAAALCAGVTFKTLAPRFVDALLLLVKPCATVTAYFESCVAMNESIVSTVIMSTAVHPCRALDYIDIAAKSEPASVYNAFLRLKIYLTQQDSQAATEQIKAMLSCDDFSHEILRVSVAPGVLQIPLSCHSLQESMY